MRLIREASPRRCDLLKSLVASTASNINSIQGLKFEVIPSKFAEDLDKRNFQNPSKQRFFKLDFFFSCKQFVIHKGDYVLATASAKTNEIYERMFKVQYHFIVEGQRTARKII